MAFTLAVIVLGAKMAKADGSVSAQEIQAFKEVFHVPEQDMQNVGKIFNQAKKDSKGFEPYARQIAELFKNRRKALEDLLDGLFHIAKADNIITPIHANIGVVIFDLNTIYAIIAVTIICDLNNATVNAGLLAY